jgi:hypothetical protein
MSWWEFLLFYLYNFQKSLRKRIIYLFYLEKGLMDRELKYGFLLGNDITINRMAYIKTNKTDYWFIRNDLELKLNIMNLKV